MNLSQLKRLFLQERHQFAKSHPRCAGVGLIVTDEQCVDNKDCSYRDMAWADLDERFIYMTEKSLALSRNNIVALIRHELGHMADPSASEQGADDIAEQVGGQKIRYDRFDVQTIGPGKYPRPRHLHR